MQRVHLGQPRREQRRIGRLRVGEHLDVPNRLRKQLSERLVPALRVDPRPGGEQQASATGDEALQPYHLVGQQLADVREHDHVHRLEVGRR